MSRKQVSLIRTKVKLKKDSSYRESYIDDFILYWENKTEILNRRSFIYTKSEEENFFFEEAKDWEYDDE